MTYNFKYVSKHLRSLIEPASEKSHRFEEELGYRVFRNAYVAPYVHWNSSIGCVIDKDGRTVKDSECIEWKENADYYDLSTSVSDHKKIIFLGFLLNGFGHSYTDDLRKLWFLSTDKYSELYNAGYELVYITSWNKPIPQHVLDIIRFAGINLQEARHITVLTQFDEVVIPDSCFRATDYGRVYSFEYEQLIDNIIHAIPCADVVFPKVYFTRTHYVTNPNKEQGEKEIERVFCKLGYRVIGPEEYSVVEQLQMIRNCSHFAATEGSVAHLSLFCKENTDVVIINKANYLNFHQVMVNEFANLNVTYIEAHHSSEANKDYPWWGPFYLCVNHFLEHYAHRPILYIPYWLRYSYWKYTRNILYKCINRIKKCIKWIRSYL